MQAPNYSKQETEDEFGGSQVLRDRQTSPSRQLVCFLVVGGLNTFFGYALFAALSYVGLAYPIAIGLATVGGVLFNFQSVGRLVFDGAPQSRFLRFVAVYCVIYCINVSGVGLLLRIGANVYVANAILLAPLSMVAFILNRRFVFHRP